MFFPSPYTWNMVKDAPNHVPMNMIGLSQNSREILEDGDAPILPLVLSTPYSLHFCDRTIIPLSTFCTEVNTICIWQYVQYQSATQGPFLINKFWINFTVSLQSGVTKNRYNIRHIRPYTYDTNIEDINTEKYLWCCQHISYQLYTSVFILKLVTK